MKSVELGIFTLAHLPLDVNLPVSGRLRLKVLIAAYAADFNGQWQAGLAPTAQAGSATIATLLAYQGFHVIVLVLAGAYLLARSWSGHLTHASRNTLDNVGLMWHCATLQGVVGAFTINLLPWLMEL